MNQKLYYVLPYKSEEEKAFVEKLIRDNTLILERSIDDCVKTVDGRIIVKTSARCHPEFCSMKFTKASVPSDLLGKYEPYSHEAILEILNTWVKEENIIVTESKAENPTAGVVVK